MSYIAYYYSDGDCTEVYCEWCLPVSTKHEDVSTSEFGGNYVDSPACCSVCLRNLDCDYTNEGIEYVIEKLREEMAKPVEKRNEIHENYKGTYWEGSPHWHIVDEWAKQLRNYGGHPWSLVTDNFDRAMEHGLVIPVDAKLLTEEEQEDAWDAEVEVIRNGTEAARVEQLDIYPCIFCGLPSPDGGVCPHCGQSEVER